MTPFRNDAQNPFDRVTPWPRLPQTPLWVSTYSRRSDDADDPDAEDPSQDAGDDEPEWVFFDSEAALFDGSPEAELFASPGPDLRPERTFGAPPPPRGFRMMPLLGAAATGVAGLVTLYLTIGPPFGP